MACMPAWAAPSGTPLAALSPASPAYTQAAQCAQPQPQSACTCGGLPCGVLVRLRLPSALIETLRGPADSAFGPGAPAVLGASASSSAGGTQNTSDARVWRLSAQAIPGGLACWSTCLPLPDEGAEPPPFAGTDPVGSQEAPLAGPDGIASCEPPTAPLAQAAALLGAIPGITLAWSSALDPVAWRTGCRDLARAARALACIGSTAVGAACLGAWGPLYPRQMRDIGPDPLLHAARTALRALSLAHDPFGTLAFGPGPQGRLEQVVPATSRCLRVGELPLPVAGSADLPVRPSVDGRHAWLWWQTHQCCIVAPLLATCLAAIAH